MWFKVDDKLHDHRKVQELLERGDGEALALWLLAGSWSGDQLSDGLISPFVLGRWFPDWQAKAEALVSVGLWEPAEQNGRPHFQIHDFLDYNDSRDTIESDRRANAMRAKFHRDAALKSAILRRDKDRCRYCGTQVNWKAKRGNDAATYDHVKPIVAPHNGTNTLENVVVACKGCNDRKNRRTLKEAGMKQLPPGSLGAPLIDEDAPASDAYSVRSENDPSTSEADPRSTTGSGRVGSGTKNVPNTKPERRTA